MECKTFGGVDVKRYIRSSESIYGMSFTRKFIIGKMTGYGNVISEHIIKCVSQDGTQNAIHIDTWLYDISKAIYNISSFTVDTGNKRLKSRDYQKGLFDDVYGTSIQDMKCILQEWQFWWGRSDKTAYLADFDITDNMCRTAYQLVSELRSVVPEWISSYRGKDGIPISETRQNLRSIFSKYLTFKTGENNWRSIE